MNLLNLRRRYRRRSGIESTAVLANSAVDQDLNQAYQDICTAIANANEDFFEEQKSKFNLGLNSGLYALPTDCIKVKQMRFAYTTPTTESDYKIASEYDAAEIQNVSFDEVNAPQSNPIVDITNNFFRLNPRPTTAVTNGGEMYYIALPSALVLTSDTPIIPTQYHDLISLGASLMPLSVNVQDKKYVIYSKEYENKLALMLNQIVPRNVNRQKRMRNPLELSQPKQTLEIPRRW